MLSIRLSDKIKQSCEKNILPLVLTDWLLNGSVKDKEDAYEIIENIDDVIIILNGIYQQINTDIITKEKVYDDIFSSLNEILSKTSKYGSIDTRNRMLIETRGWLIPIYTICATKDNKSSCIDTLNRFMDGRCDILTYFWTLSSFIYELDIEKSVIKTKVDSIESTLTTKNRLYWLIKIWNINEHNDSLDEVNELFNNKDNYCLIEFFTALRYKYCLRIKDKVEEYLYVMIADDLQEYWCEKNINLYKTVILCIINYGTKELKIRIKETQENYQYLLFRLLSITRSYESRIWDEIRIQLLVALRIYTRVTKRKVNDELKEELVSFDVLVSYEACKTLLCIFGIEPGLKIIIKILTEESKNTELERKIMNISYSLKILSLKDNEILNKLDDILAYSNDHTQKNIIRILLTEMGGFSAINKIKDNQSMREKYIDMTTTAQTKIESMFHKSITDAKKAFKISLWMNISIFTLGISLLAASGFSAIINNDEQNWAATGLSSGTGFLSVVYSLFVNKPSRKIRKNTNHLMRLKVIFLGYLRELSQMDQSFSKNLLEVENIEKEELDGYIGQINSCMSNALESLRWEETV